MLGLSIRSLLVVPAGAEDDPTEALSSNADGLIIDLVSTDGPRHTGHAAARRLIEAAAAETRIPVFVRIDSVAGERSGSDLDSILLSRPAGIVPSDILGAADIDLLSAQIAVREALYDLEDGSTRILAAVAPSTAATFLANGFRRRDSRLIGLIWADPEAMWTGAVSSAKGTPLKAAANVARSMSVLAAAAAEIPIFDAASPREASRTTLAKEARDSAREGFAGKLATHSRQIGAINAAFRRNATTS